MKSRSTAVPGVFRYWRFDSAGRRFTLGPGRVAGGWGTSQADAGEVGFIFPVGIAWLLSLVYSCPSRVFQLPFAVRQPLLVYLGGSLSLAYGADLSGLLPALAFLFKVPRTRASPVMLGAGQGSFVHKRRYELSGVRVLSLQFSALSLDGEVHLGAVTLQGCRPPRFR